MLGNYVQQDRQCTYNVPFKCIRVTIFAVEKQKVLNIMDVCLYSCLSYPA
jgi:hypothetical protein